MAIDWTMSAALENVPRGDSEVPEVTSLQDAVRAWLALDDGMRSEATLTPERPVAINDEAVVSFSGQAIQGLAERLPD